MSQLSMTFNQRKAGTLPSDTVQNQRKDGSCLSITTMRGKVLENPSKGKSVVDSIEENIVKVDCDNSVKVENQDEVIHDTTPSCQQSEKIDNGKQNERKWWRKLFQIHHHLFIRDEEG